MMWGPGAYKRKAPTHTHAHRFTSLNSNVDQIWVVWDSPLEPFAHEKQCCHQYIVSPCAMYPPILSGYARSMKAGYTLAQLRGRTLWV